jgi:prophage tail gpP-like protein
MGRSGNVNGKPMSATLASGPGEVIVLTGSNQFKGWQTVSISKSCESMPNSWAVTASAEFLQGDALAGTQPGQSCLIRIGSDLVITGWIDRRSIAIDAHNHQVTISGRGITRNLVDCSVDLVHDPALRGGQMICPNALDAAQKLCKAYGITARSAVSDLGPPILGYQVQLNDTPYSVIESVARYAGFLVYEDLNGNLVLDRVGTTAHASGFSLPGNIESVNAEQSVDQRYSQYLVVWSGIDQLAELGDLFNRRAHKLDTTLNEFRLKVIVSEQIAWTPSQALPDTANDTIAEQRANWEFARRYGRSQAVSITCDSWRDSNGTLWTPNWLAPVDAPAAGIAGVKWIIGSVTYRKDMSGTHADLILMPPDAFLPDPNPLNLFDAELLRSPQTSQAPAPPTTSPAAPSTSAPL